MWSQTAGLRSLRFSNAALPVPKRAYPQRFISSSKASLTSNARYHCGTIPVERCPFNLWTRVCSITNTITSNTLIIRDNLTTARVFASSSCPQCCHELMHIALKWRPSQSNSCWSSLLAEFLWLTQSPTNQIQSSWLVQVWTSLGPRRFCEVQRVSSLM